MYDMNVMPYGADDERNTLIDDDGVLHSAAADTHYVFGDTPAYRRTGITDQQAARWKPVTDDRGVTDFVPMGDMGERIPDDVARGLAAIIWAAASLPDDAS